MIELFIAIGAGLLSFLSPCVLPLIPGYISYISGSSLQELIEKKNINLFPVILFTLGFSIIFIAFGAATTFFGQVLLQNSYELRIGAGLVIIILSLQIIVPDPFLGEEYELLILIFHLINSIKFILY